MKLANNMKESNPTDDGPAETTMGAAAPAPAPAPAPTGAGVQTKKDSESFEDFWKANCSMWAQLALILFYVGTLSLLVAILIFVWAQFSITYKQSSAAFVAIGLIALSIAVGTILVIWFSLQDQSDLVKIKSYREDNAVANTGHTNLINGHEIHRDLESTGGNNIGSGSTGIRCDFSCGNAVAEVVEEKEGDHTICFAPPVRVSSSSERSVLDGDSVDYSDFLLRQKSYPIIYNDNPLAPTLKFSEDVDLEEFKDNNTLL